METLCVSKNVRKNVLQKLNESFSKKNVSKLKWQKRHRRHINSEILQTNQSKKKPKKKGKEKKKNENVGSLGHAACQNAWYCLFYKEGKKKRSTISIGLWFFIRPVGLLQNNFFTAQIFYGIVFPTETLPK